MNLDPIDETVLKAIYDGKSILEICSIVNRAPAAIHKRLLDLEAEGYVTPPPKPHMPRMRRLTGMGESYLIANGYIDKTPLVFDVRRR